jgi:predicted nucleotidyltransferase
MTALEELPQVESLLLSGSRTSGTADERSDYDVYVYVSDEIPVPARREIVNQHCSSMELDNRYWETEDDGYLSDGTPIELIYRSLDWLRGELRRVLIHHVAAVGYSTCLWHNLLHSQILFDRNGRTSALLRDFSISYPDELRRAIVRRNYPLLRTAFPSYRKQIDHALRRSDRVSVNHRVAAFLASYFDILFAVNRLPHPGEKRLIHHVLADCRLIPVDMERDVDAVLSGDQTAAMRPAEGILFEGSGLLASVDRLVDRLEELMRRDESVADLLA